MISGTRCWPALGAEKRQRQASQLPGSAHTLTGNPAASPGDSTSLLSHSQGWQGAAETQPEAHSDSAELASVLLGHHRVQSAEQHSSHGPCSSAVTHSPLGGHCLSWR